MARWLRIGVLTCLLAATYAATWRSVTTEGHGPIGMTALADGEEVTVTLYEVGRIDGPQRYWLRRGELGIAVAGPTEGLTLGDELTVHGVVYGGVLSEAWRADAPLRRAKKRLGFLGLALAGGLAVITVRWIRGGWDVRG